MTHSVNPVQTAPKGAILSESDRVYTVYPRLSVKIYRVNMMLFVENV